MQSDFMKIGKVVQKVDIITKGTCELMSFNIRKMSLSESQQYECKIKKTHSASRGMPNAHMASIDAPECENQKMAVKLYKKEEAADLIEQYKETQEDQANKTVHMLARNILQSFIEDLK